MILFCHGIFNIFHTYNIIEFFNILFDIMISNIDNINIIIMKIRNPCLMCYKFRLYYVMEIRSFDYKDFLHAFYQIKNIQILIFNK